MAGPDQQAPAVAISFPADNAQLDLAVFTLTGNASDNAGPVASVELSLNGGQATVVPVTAGAFSMQVRLKPGANTLTVSARDAAGNVGTVTSSATFNAGVSGFAHVAADETQRVSGAVVELRQPGTGVVLSTATTDASGAFSLAATTVPLDYVIVVRAPHFLTSSQTVTVPEDQRLVIKVGLQPGEQRSGPGTIIFSDPLEGSTWPAARRCSGTRRQNNPRPGRIQPHCCHAQASRPSPSAGPGHLRIGKIRNGIKRQMF